MQKTWAPMAVSQPNIAWAFQWDSQQGNERAAELRRGWEVNQPRLERALGSTLVHSLAIVDSSPIQIKPDESGEIKLDDLVFAATKSEDAREGYAARWGKIYLHYDGLDELADQYRQPDQRLSDVRARVYDDALRRGLAELAFSQFLWAYTEQQTTWERIKTTMGRGGIIPINMGTQISLGLYSAPWWSSVAAAAAFAGFTNGIDLACNYRENRSLDLQDKMWSIFPDGFMFDKAAIAWTDRQAQLVRPRPKEPRRAKIHYTLHNAGSNSRD